jgi:hypothetical protein
LRKDVSTAGLKKERAIASVHVTACGRCGSTAAQARLHCLYYFFLAVVVIRYETTATARWALLFIVRAFFNDTITVAVWTGFHACAHGMRLHRRDFIRRRFTDPTVVAANWTMPPR